MPDMRAEFFDSSKVSEVQFTIQLFRLIEVQRGLKVNFSIYRLVKLFRDILGPTVD